MGKFHWKKVVLEIEKLTAHYESTLQQARSYKEESEKTRSKPNQQDLLAEEKQLADKELEDERCMRQLETEINNIKTTLSTLQLKWTRKKEGKDMEFRDLKKQVDTESQSCSKEKVEIINKNREQDSLISDMDRDIQEQ